MVYQSILNTNTLRNIYNRLITTTADINDIMEMSGQPKDHSLTKACTWIESEQTLACSQHIKRWLQLVDQGKTGDIGLDPTAYLPTQEDVAEVIAASREMYNITQPEKDLLAVLEKMPEETKRIFTQGYLLILKTTERVLEEAQQRVDKGEEFPHKEE